MIVADSDLARSARARGLAVSVQRTPIHCLTLLPGSPQANRSPCLARLRRRQCRSVPSVLAIAWVPHVQAGSAEDCQCEGRLAIRRATEGRSP